MRICFYGCRFARSCCPCSSWRVSVSLLFTSLYTKICYCVERPRWQLTMPQAEGGPRRSSSPLGSQPRIALQYHGVQNTPLWGKQRQQPQPSKMQHIFRSNCRWGKSSVFCIWQWHQVDLGWENETMSPSLQVLSREDGNVFFTFVERFPYQHRVKIDRHLHVGANYSCPVNLHQTLSVIMCHIEYF